MPASAKQITYLRDLIQIERNHNRKMTGLNVAQSQILMADIQQRIEAEIATGLDSHRASELIDAAKGLPDGAKAMLVTLRYTREDLLALDSAARKDS